MKKATQSLYIKTTAAAQALGVTPQTVRASVDRGDLPGFRLGSHYYVSRQFIEERCAVSSPANASSC